MGRESRREAIIDEWKMADLEGSLEENAGIVKDVWRRDGHRDAEMGESFYGLSEDFQL